MPGHLIVFSAPGGVGKDSVIRGLLTLLPDCVRNITTTSRPMREGETDGRDYFFLTTERFQEKIKHGDFIEYNFFTGNYYGTERERLNQLLAEHQLVITQADINGKKSLDREGIPHLAIFLLPDNLAVLRGRLEKRGSMSPEQIEELKAIMDKCGNVNEAGVLIAKVISVGESMGDICSILPKDHSFPDLEDFLLL
jgi:guanylate kinase